MIATKDTTTPLTTAEQAELAEQEAIVERGLKSFVDVGHALQAIHEKKLYREQYRTFGEYVKYRWEMGRAYAYRLIDSATIVDELSPIGDITPANESQCRPLTQIRTKNGDLDMKRIRRAWADVVKEAPTVNGVKDITADRVSCVTDGRVARQAFTKQKRDTPPSRVTLKIHRQPLEEGPRGPMGNEIVSKNQYEDEAKVEAVREADEMALDCIRCIPSGGCPVPEDIWFVLDRLGRMIRRGMGNWTADWRQKIADAAKALTNVLD